CKGTWVLDLPGGRQCRRPTPLFHGAIGHVDHNGPRLGGLEGAIVNFCPQRSERDFHRIGNLGSAYFLDSPAATASAARSPAPRSTSGALGADYAGETEE